MNYKNMHIILLLCIINNVYAKRTGTRPIIPTTQPQTTIEKGPQLPSYLSPMYSAILAILQSKKPDSSDFVTLKNLANEAQQQITLIQERKPDLRAKSYIIQDAASIQTYSDIYQALTQQSADSSHLSTLNNIKNEAEQQMKEIQASVQKKPVIMPVIGELTYSKILSALEKNRPDSSDFATLNNIITEATRQRDSLIKK